MQVLSRQTLAQPWRRYGREGRYRLDMSRFVLDCAVSRPVSGQVAAWLTSAVQTAWASPSAGYHEAKQSSLMLDQSVATMAGLTGARNVRFCPDIPVAVGEVVAQKAPGATTVATSVVDSLQVQQAVARGAAAAGLPHRLLAVDAAGRLDREALDALPTPALLVTNLGNQEIGTVQIDLSEWSRSTGSAVVLDASTAFGWIDLPDYWSHLLLDARSWGGVPGAVAVCASQDSTRRPAENVPAAAVAAVTAEQWLAKAPGARTTARRQLGALRDIIANGLDGVEMRGGTADDLPHVLSVSVLYVDAEALQSRLDALGYAVGSGSACASREGQPSHVLAAVGGLTSGNLRVGLPPDLPDDAVTGFGEALVDCVRAVREQMGTQDL